MKALVLLFSILLLLLFANLWVGHGSLPKRWQLEKEISSLEAETEKQQTENARIKAELEDAKSGHDAIEERARSELGMTHKDETFYEVILKPEDELPVNQNIKSQPLIIQTEGTETDQNKLMETGEDKQQ